MSSPKMVEGPTPSLKPLYSAALWLPVIITPPSMPPVNHRKIQQRRRHDADIDHVDAARQQPFDQQLEQAVGGQPAVAAERDRRLAGPIEHRRVSASEILRRNRRRNRARRRREYRTREKPADSSMLPASAPRAAPYRVPARGRIHHSLWKSARSCKLRFQTVAPPGRSAAAYRNGRAKDRARRTGNRRRTWNRPRDGVGARARGLRAVPRRAQPRGAGGDAAAFRPRAGALADRADRSRRRGEPAGAVRRRDRAFRTNRRAGEQRRMGSAAYAAAQDQRGRRRIAYWR